MYGKETEKRYREIKETAEAGGYTMNPDRDFCLRLVDGLLKNAERYGKEFCPCRLVMGDMKENLDIECPCYYRADDLNEYGACFCALYVTDGYDPNKQVPERRPPKAERKKQESGARFTGPGTMPYPIWRCGVCGYLCANNNPPQKCPVCKAGKERFEQFL